MAKGIFPNYGMQKKMHIPNQNNLIFLTEKEKILAANAFPRLPRRSIILSKFAWHFHMHWIFLYRNFQFCKPHNISSHQNIMRCKPFHMLCNLSLCCIDIIMLTWKYNPYWNINSMREKNLSYSSLYLQCLEWFLGIHSELLSKYE